MLKNLIVKILIGIPASGKSTWAKEFIKKNSNYIRVNRDDFRFMLKDQPTCEHKVEEMITTMSNNTIITALTKNFNVIVDNTNLKPEYINTIVDLVLPYANIEFQIFDISIEKAIERDNLREKKVGETVIKKMYKDYKKIIDVYNFQNLKQKPKIYKNKKFDKNLPNAVIFDIDGTLAHMNNKRSPFDWNRVDVDDLDEIVARQITVHKKYGDIIILLSGRDSAARPKTEEWLDFYQIEYDHLFMRKANDFRKDSIVKKELYNNYVKDKFNVYTIYDDRQQVVDMWRNELGLKVFQVEPGNF